MSAAPRPRLAAATGLVTAAAVALWWLGNTRLELDRGGDASRSAAAALTTLALVRAGLLTLLGSRLAVLHGAGAGLAMALLMVAPAWPVVVLAWSASRVPGLALVVLELALVALAATLMALGHLITRLLPQRERADLAAATLGVVLAALVWRAWWASWFWPLPLV